MSEALVTLDRWTIHDLELTKEKVAAIWELLKKYRTLFSDLTYDDPENFITAITNPGSLWYEVREADTLIGLIYLDHTYQVIDYNAHFVFFDRKIPDKVELCKGMVRWIFRNFPVHRITVTIPDIFFSIKRLMKKIGFTYEGTKREATLIGGKWIGVCVYGITRAEVE